MLLRTVFLLCMQYGVVFPFFNQKQLAQTMWPGRCSQHQHVLNDCNWCVCDQQSKFVCKARVCQEVDMFGHFNDAIREYIVGMEGHGSWRSDGSVCTPRMQYEREGLLCVCSDDGTWPNPVCRDLFRVLHEVETTGHLRPSALHECTPRRLYLYGCNVCLCPPDGRIRPDDCTRNNCSDTDPVLNQQQNDNNNERYDLSEVYAECALDRKYIIGCSKCVCLKNNRLLCDNCDRESARTESENDYCAKNGVREMFNIDCNICVCDERGVMYCTTRRCLNDSPKPDVELSETVDLTLRTVEPPIDSFECDLGTKYRKGCNTCFCTGTNERKSLSCTLKECSNPGSQKVSALEAIRSDCVENTVYEANCLLCRCDVVDGVKSESCLLSPVCDGAGAGKARGTVDLDAMRGYCEPAHEYRWGCNACRCLADGKVAACGARVCPAAHAQPLEVDVVPVRQSGAIRCPRDHMYKVDCNFCFCLKNGNFLCTTAKCDE